MAALKSVRAVSVPSGAMYIISQPELPRMAETAKPSFQSAAAAMLRPGLVTQRAAPVASSTARMWAEPP